MSSLPGDVASERWSSVGFSSSPAQDSSSAHFFHNSCHDNSAPQPFCSPNTPGPSPHYPQTPTICSPAPQMLPREERLDFHTQTPRQLSRAEALSSCLQEYSSNPLITDGAQQRPHQTNHHFLQGQSELIQDRTSLQETARDSESCFSPPSRGQEVSGTAQPAGLPAGLSWREECKGVGGGRGGENSQPDWTWVSLICKKY